MIQHGDGANLAFEAVAEPFGGELEELIRGPSWDRAPYYLAHVVRAVGHQDLLRNPLVEPFHSAGYAAGFSSIGISL